MNNSIQPEPRDMVKTWRCEKTHLKKGAWSPEEDQMLKAYIKRYGIWNWNEMSKAAGTDH